MLSTQAINDRLKNYANSHDMPDVTKARVALCLERIIARLMKNDFLSKSLIFGGGFVLYKDSNSNRYTMDADAVVTGIDTDDLILEVTQSLSLDLKDGFWFGEPILEKLESGYGGIRFKILYKAGLPFPTQDEWKRLRRVHLDISVGIDLSQVAKRSILNSTLDIYEDIEWNIYPPEFICAEKIHCLLDRKDLNTRGKDVYDLQFLINKTDNLKLFDALNITFNNRKFTISSLYEVAEQIDTHNLEQNFNKAQFKNRNVNFDQSWKKILNKLKEMDHFFSSKN